MYNIFKMRKISFALLLVSTLPLVSCTNANMDRNLVPANRIVQEPVYPETQYAPTRAQFLSTQSPDIQKALAIYQKTGKAPIIQTNEFVKYPFGLSQPIINCLPLNVCDVVLEHGERVRAIDLGDKARWTYSVDYSGSSHDLSSIQAHVAFKPKDYDLSTSAIIITNRRAYYLGLISSKQTYVRQVRFYYPNDIQKQWNKLLANSQQHWSAHNANTVAKLPNIDVNNLDFNYHINKPLFANRPAWMPVRAFNDGTHVYIEMPASMRTSNAPALFVINNNGQKALVNYRVRDNYYIVDDLFKKAVMVTGVGRTQERVTINYYG